MISDYLIGVFSPFFVGEPLILIMRWAALFVIKAAIYVLLRKFTKINLRLAFPLAYFLGASLALCLTHAKLL